MTRLSALKRRLFFLVGGITVVAVLTAAVLNWRTLQKEQQAERASSRYALEVYMERLDRAFDSMEKMLVTQTLEDGVLEKIREPRRELARYLAFVEKKEVFEEEIGKYEFLDGLFLYDRDYADYLGVKSDHITNAEHTTIKKSREQIVAAHEAHAEDGGWFYRAIEKTGFLFCVVEVRGIYFCAWIKVDNLLAELEKERTADEMSYYAICDGEGRILSTAEPLAGKWLSGRAASGQTVKLAGKTYRAESVSSEKRDLALVHFTENNTLADFAGLVAVPLLEIALFAVLAFSAAFLLTKKVFLKPFSEMVLEEELAKNEAQLQYLQHQTNPHFLNNCLSLVRNLLLLERTEEAEETILLLGKYTRSSLNPQTTITLAAELAHVQTYCDLQRKRFGERLSVELHAEETVLPVEVPTMLVHTFVENAVKHQMDTEQTLEVRVDAAFSEKNRLVVTVRDNGDGFPQELLSQLALGLPITDAEGLVHVGISNLVKRLTILYGANAAVTFANGDAGGAVVTVAVTLADSTSKDSDSTLEDKALEVIERTGRACR